MKYPIINPLFDEEDVGDAYASLSLKDPQKRQIGLSESKLMHLVPNGDTKERVATLIHMLCTTVEEQRNDTRRRYGLNVPIGTMHEQLREQAREEFRLHESDMDCWSAVYFYRLCRWKRTEVAELLVELHRYASSTSERKVNDMEKQAFRRLYALFARPQLPITHQPQDSLRDSSTSSKFLTFFDPIPKVDNFIPRPEFDAYCQQLNDQKWTFITGESGTGKTALAAKLAEWLVNNQHKVIWVHVSRRFTMELLLEHIAHDLGVYGDTEYYDQLAKLDAEQSIDEERSVNADWKFQTKLNTLMLAIEKQNYALVLDDAQHLNVDDRFQLFVQKLRPGSHARLPLIIISKERLDILPIDRLLGGLPEEAVEKWLRNAGIILPDVLFRPFYDKVQGNPKLVELFIAEIRSQGILDRDEAIRNQQYKILVEHLARTSQVHNHLVQNLLPQPAGDERKLMQIISVFRSKFDINDPSIHKLLATEGIEHAMLTLHKLQDKNLVTHLTGAAVTCHDIVREFFYDGLSYDESRYLHQCIAQCHKDRGDFFEAAYQWHKAGDPGQAAHILMQHAEEFFTRSTNASALKDLQWLIPKLCAQQNVSQRWQLYDLLGRAQDHLGNYAEAHAAYEQALNELRQHDPILRCPQIDLLIRSARLQRLLGSNKDALDELDQAEHIALDCPDNTEALVRIKAAQISTHRLLSNVLASIECGEAALTYDHTVTSAEVIIELYRALGHTYLDQGDVSQSRDFFETAQREVSRLNGHSNQMNIMLLIDRMSLSTLSEGQLKDAIELGQKALNYARRSNSIFLLERTYGNLGLAHDWAGNFDEALQYYQQSLELSERSGHARGKAIDLGNMGVTYYQKGKIQQDPVQAQKYLRQAQKYLRQALKYFRGSSDPFIAYVAAHLSFIVSTPKNQRFYADLACEEAKRSKHAIGRVLAYRARAKFDQAVDQTSAMMWLEKAIDVASKKPLLLHEAVCRYELSKIHSDPQICIENYEQAIAQFKKSGAQGWLKQAEAHQQVDPLLSDP